MDLIGAVFTSLGTLRAAVRTFIQLSGDYNSLLARISQSPGIPSSPTTFPYWQGTVPEAARLLHASETSLPHHADIVIIGSGLTGTLIARALLDHPKSGDLKVVIVEARDVCIGATARNGGHIKCDPHLIYHKHKASHGKEFAAKATRFSMAHVDELIRVSEKVGGEAETETRRVETVDVYFDAELFARVCNKIKTFQTEMPVEGKDIKILSAQEAQEAYGLSSLCVGATTSSAGALNPYKLVTRLLTSLEEKYPDRFTLVSRCPITNIQEPSEQAPFYTLHTEKGQITASHVVHATNAHVAHLVPGLRSKVFPLRQAATAQSHRSFAHSSAGPGERSFTFFYSEGFDYLSQRPDGTIVLGGGFAQSPQQGMAEVGINTDNAYDLTATTHLCGVLSALFNDPEEVSDPSNPNATNRVKTIWAGSIGVSADFLPWVGRLPTRLTGRKVPPASEGTKLASPGEWVSAGYTGEGVVNAPLCAKALAMMILKLDDDNVSSWFPEEMRVTEKRWKKADPSMLLEDLWD